MLAGLSHSLSSQLCVLARSLRGRLNLNPGLLALDLGPPSAGGAPFRA